MADSDRWTITKLDGEDNWSTWKFQVKHFMLAKGLWKYVEGTVFESGASDTEMQRAFSYLVMSIAPSQLYLITTCDSPQEAWKILTSHFDRNTLANKLFLKKQYFRCEMREGESVVNHIKRMKELSDKLASIGSVISEEDQMVTLLGSLPASYSSLVTALEARVEDVDLKFVQQALINEEQKKTGSSAQTQSSTAMMGVKKNKGGSKQSKPEKSIKCFGCGEIGHFKRNCKNKKSKSGGAGPQHNAKAASNTEAVSNTEAASNAETLDVGDYNVFVSMPQRFDADKWFVDSGASSHMTPMREMMTNYKTLSTPEKITIGDGRTVNAIGKGNIRVDMLVDKEEQRSILYGVLHVPDLACSLFSVRAAAQKNKVVSFSDTSCTITDAESGVVYAKGSMINNMYILNFKKVPLEQASAACEKNAEADLWHQRLGHLNEQQLNDLVRQNLVKESIPTSLSFCEGCVEGKMHKKPFNSVGEIRSKRKLQLVHSDVCGPMQTESLGKKKYYVTFIDDYSRCCAVYFMRNKSEVFEKFKEFEAEATAACGEKISVLRSDNGGEYTSCEFQDFLKLKGIHHQLSVPYSPQQNGVAERMNRTIVESARCMIKHAGLPNSYWAEAIATAVYIRNRVTTSALKMKTTPYERWYERKPDLKHLRVFGCIAYAHIPDEKRQKLDKKAEKLRFVGYSLSSKGYRLYDEVSKQVVIRRDVVFNEDDFAREKVVCLEEEKQDMEPIDQQLDNSKKEENASEPDRSDRPDRPRRVIKPPDRYGEWAEVAHHFAYMINEPKSYQEAVKSQYSDEWKKAADSEYKSLMDNETWSLVELPENRKAIGCRWVFKVKHGKDGEIERFKGRLVAKGYAQKQGFDFDETFSPVVRFSSIRTLLSFAVQRKMLIHQMDVVTAFLNGEINEEVYMEQPEGYIKSGNEGLVCKLKKSLYGLKQSSRCWNKVFKEYMEAIGFKGSSADPCVFIQAGKTMNIIAVYVDDLILITENEKEMTKVKEKLSSRFQMKDMGKLHYCLGINISQDEENGSVMINQKQYILNMLEKYGMKDAKPVSTPGDPNVKLVANDEVSKSLSNPSKYQSLVGSLLYAAMATRPDIAYAVGVLGKFNANPSEAHFTAAKRVLRYLKGTVDWGLRYQCKSDELVGYSDADFAGDEDDRHSTTGNVFLLAGSAVSWLSRKQRIVALSTAEAEYVALSSATQEIVSLRKLLSDLNCSELKSATVLMEDNQSAIAIAHNPVSHARTKHIDIRYHYVREAIQDNVVALKYCPTDEMTADVLTKFLPKRKFEKFREALGLCVI